MADSIFPFIVIPDMAADRPENLPLFQEYAWDFDNDRLLLRGGRPVLVEENEALRVWIYKALRTPRGRYLAYGGDFGCEIEDIIGGKTSAALKKIELERVVIEGLLRNPYIVAVREIEIEIVDGWARGSMIVDTVYGEMSASV